jgi:hypothetical protein
MKKGQIAMVAVKAEGLRIERETEESSMIADFPYGTGAIFQNGSKLPLERLARN